MMPVPVVVGRLRPDDMEPPEVPMIRHPVTVFCSYSHRDDKYRQRLETSLGVLRNGGLIGVWSDRCIDPGTQWATQISEQLDAAQVILLLVSFDFLASDFCYRIEMKRALKRHAAGTARVIPIILRPCDWQGTPFRELQALPTDGKPIASWRSRDEAYTQIVRSLRNTCEEIVGHASQPVIPTGDAPVLAGWEACPTEKQRDLSVTQQLYLETGSVPLDSPFYVERAEERLAVSQLASPVPTVIIKGHRQAGKSSLLTRLHAQAVQDQQQSCYLSFQDLSGFDLDDVDACFRQLAWMLSDELACTSTPDEAWTKRLSPKMNLTQFLETAILQPSPSTVMLLFDEVDTAFPAAALRHELFSMIRSWHERRPRDVHGHWKKLRLVIAHATEPTLWIEDINQSPFNVGLSRTLKDFDLGQIAELNRRHGAPLADDEAIRELHGLVGGHPFLIRLALYWLVSQGGTIDAVCQAAAEGSSGPFGTHLRYYENIFRENPRLNKVLREIAKKGKSRDQRLFDRLWAVGLVTGTASQADFRCRLYRDYFGKRL